MLWIERILYTTTLFILVFWNIHQDENMIKVHDNSVARDMVLYDMNNDRIKTDLFLLRSVSVILEAMDDPKKKKAKPPAEGLNELKEGSTPEAIY